MIQITDKHNCCGCNACANACPKACITMQADGEGFLYPHVDAATCIDCGLCERVCPMLHPRDKRVPLGVLGAYNISDDTRKRSSSGGVYMSLVHSVLSRMGEAVRKLNVS